MKFLLVAAIAVFIAGCAPQIQYPDMTLNTLQDSAYPCLKIVFTDIVRLKDMNFVTKDNESILLYNIAINSKPYYEFSVVKRHTSSVSAEWSLVAISDQYDSNVKFYEIPPSDIYFDRSAAVALIERDRQIYLRGIMGEYTTPDTLYMIISDRIVQKDSYLHLFSVEKWRNSSAGKRIIADMTELVDWYYNHTEVVSCNMPTRSDKAWWK
ncbi:MAG: hypothetical protein LBH05_07105 [Deferribacteraceae bacterium]|jgi:hypothetical protein|nr:hypothetical protein [Deferribacteraceae bacterium]